MIASLRARPTLLLVLLLLANLLLISIQARDEAGMVMLKTWGVAVRAPFGGAVHFVRSRLKRAVNQYVLLVRTAYQNQRLTRENEFLKLEAQRLRALVRSAVRSGDFDRIYQRHQLETIAASIIQRSPPFLSTTFQLNAGRAHGVQRNAAVIRPEGIVGRVQALTQWSCEVQPITQPEAGAGAILSDTRTQGVVRGQGTDLLRLDYIPISVPVRVGEFAYTSGADRIYPAGLPIGRVVSVTEGNLVHQHILLRPSADLSRPEEVLVVDPGQESPPNSGGGGDRLSQLG